MADGRSLGEMMKTSISTNPNFFRSPLSVQGHDQRRTDAKTKRKRDKETLSQWFGMKKITHQSPSLKQDLEMLRFRSFLDPNTAHQAPIKGNSTTLQETPMSSFIETGYFAGTGKKRRRKCQTFAEEWMEQFPELGDVVEKKMQQNVRKNRNNNNKNVGKKKAGEISNFGAARKKRQL